MTAQIYINNFIRNFKLGVRPTEEIVEKAFQDLGTSFLNEFETKCNLMNVGLGNNEMELVAIVMQFHEKWINVCSGINFKFPRAIKSNAFLRLISDNNPKMIAFLIRNGFFI